MILAGTGHRPKSLGGYDQHTMDKVYKLAYDELKRLDPSTVISGMALGWDQMLAKAALDQKRALWAFIPFAGQEKTWPKASQLAFHNLCDSATLVHIVSQGGFSGWAMQKRNMAMVDKCDEVLALFNGQPGGTANCVKYAQQQKKVIHNCWEKFE